MSVIAWDRTVAASACLHTPGFGRDCQDFSGLCVLALQADPHLSTLEKMSSMVIPNIECMWELLGDLEMLAPHRPPMKFHTVNNHPPASGNWEPTSHL